MSASTRSGRVRGRPGPVRGTRMRLSTAWNCGLSPRCPAVITTESGFWPCSQARCSLVVRPPRDRPRPWSAGSCCTPPAARPADPPFSRPGGVLVRPRDRGVHRHIPGDQPGRIRPRLQRGQDPRPGPVALPAAEQPYTVSHGPYRSGTSRHGAPVRVRHRIPSISWRLVHFGGRPGFLPRGSSGSSTPTARRSGPPGRWPVRWPRGLRYESLLGR